MKKLVFLGFVLLVLLRQDFWWWNSIEPLVFGFLPIGIAFQVFISLAATALWVVLVKFCWPRHLEIGEETSDSP